MFTDSQIRYLVRESLRLFRRMKVVAIVSTLIMSVSLLMLALFTLITVNLQAVAQVFRNEIELIVFLDDAHTQDDVRTLQARLLDHHGVQSVSYISKADAMQEFKTQLGADSDLLDVLEENPLPASLRVRMADWARTSEKLELTAAWLREVEGVQEVRYGDLWVQRLERYVEIFLLLDLLVGGLVAVSALFVISNTVRLTVLSRARTIEIQRLVGATDWFIRTPFIVEGAIQGAAAAAIAMAILWGVHTYATRFVGPLLFYDRTQVAGFIALCAIVSALGSWSSLRRSLANWR